MALIATLGVCCGSHYQQYNSIKFDEITYGEEIEKITIKNKDSSITIMNGSDPMKAIDELQEKVKMLEEKIKKLEYEQDQPRKIRAKEPIEFYLAG